MKFGRGKRPALLSNKGSRTAMLPSPKAVREITGGTPAQQSLGNYAKLTPSGLADVTQPYDDITEMGIQPAIRDK